MFYKSFFYLSCWWDLNPRPLPYQGSALPLSYNSKKSGRRDSNPRPSAWKANALSTELLPQFQHSHFNSVDRAFLCLSFGNWATSAKKCGQWRIRTSEVERQLSYSQPQLATLVTARYNTFDRFFTFPLQVEPLVGFEPTTPRLQITCSGQLS